MKLIIKKKINAPKNELWSYIADFSNIYRFHPLLSDSHFTNGSDSCEIGSTRQCNMKDGGFIKEKMVDLKQGSSYTITIEETSMPVKKAIVTMGVNELSKEKSEVYMHMDMTPKNKFLQPMMYLMFKFKIGPSILNGLATLHRKEK